MAEKILELLPGWPLAGVVGGVLVALGALLILIAVLPGGRRLREWTGELGRSHRILGLVLGLGVGLVGGACILRCPSAPTVASPANGAAERPDPDSNAGVETLAGEGSDAGTASDAGTDAEETLGGGEDARDGDRPGGASMLRGSVVTLNHAESLGALHANYYFIVGDSEGVQGAVEESGEFRLAVSRSDDGSRAVSWHWREPSEFVIWPLQWHGGDAGGAPLFQFELVTDVSERVKADVRGDIAKGDFDAANDRLEELVLLFEKFDRIDEVDDEDVLLVRSRRWRYTAYRDATHAARLYRRQVGANNVDVSLLEREREWRRGAIVAAGRQARPARALDVTRAMNELLTFAREAYRPSEAVWPNRRVGSCGRRLIRGEIDCAWLQEDVRLILEHLGSAAAAEFLSTLAGRRGERLRPGERVTLESFMRRRAETTPETVRLGQLAEVLSALQRLAGAGEPDRDDGLEAARRDVTSVGVLSRARGRGP